MLSSQQIELGCFDQDREDPSLSDTTLTVSERVHQPSIKHRKVGRPNKPYSLCKRPINKEKAEKLIIELAGGKEEALNFGSVTKATCDKSSVYFSIVQSQ
jgi:hypothetical protein